MADPLATFEAAVGPTALHNVQRGFVSFCSVQCCCPAKPLDLAALGGPAKIMISVTLDEDSQQELKTVFKNGPDKHALFKSKFAWASAKVQRGGERERDRHV